MAVLALTFVLIVELSRWSLRDVRQISGTVVGYQRTETKRGGAPLLVVKLSSGKQILVKVDGEAPVYIGRRVMLAETETRLFGLHFYDFAGYVRDDDQRWNSVAP
jgi:hypothetical protein